MSLSAHDERNRLALVQEDRLQWRHERIGHDLGQDLDPARHARTHVGVRVQDLDLRAIEPRVRIRPPTALVREQGDECHATFEVLAGERVDDDLARLADHDLLEHGFVHRRLHDDAGRARDREDLLSLAHLRADLDRIAAAHPSAAFDARVDDHAGLGREQSPLADLVDDLLELLLLEIELRLARHETGFVVGESRLRLQLRPIEPAFGFFDVGLDLDLLARVVVAIQEVERAQRLEELHLGALELELVTLQLGLRQEALLLELLRPVVGVLRLFLLGLGQRDFFLRLGQRLGQIALEVLLLVLLREEQLALGGLDVALVLALLDLELRLRLDEGRLGVLDRNFLRYSPVAQLGDVELAQEVARLHHRPLLDQGEDGDLTFDLALDRERVLRGQVSALHDADHERLPLDRRAQERLLLRRADPAGFPSAERGAPEGDQSDPDPGSRALFRTHSPSRDPGSSRRIPVSSSRKSSMSR